jgi:hypothetical protein
MAGTYNIATNDGKNMRYLLCNQRRAKERLGEWKQKKIKARGPVYCSAYRSLIGLNRDAGKAQGKAQGKA